jgi:TolB-like protein
MVRGAAFLDELKRRRVFRALVGWGIFSFALLQVYEPVMHGLHLPEWTLSLVVVLLAVGFPATVVLSWIFDLSPAGIERTPPTALDGGPAATGLGALRLAVPLLALGLLAALPGLGWYFLWRDGARAGPAPTAAAPPGGSAEAALKTVAVLPLLNLSGDTAQEYFSDGMTEEITSKLSRLSGLAVTSRTSAARFKGSPRSAREIGAELAVTYLVEGSVRRAGDRIRVTAALVRVADAMQLWSEDLDARLDDIFAVQERIAGRIVDALGLKLSPGEARALGSWGTANAGAYDLYLKGQALFATGADDLGTLERAEASFDAAIAIDPGFAPALAGKAACEALRYRDWESRPFHLERAEALVGRALALDPELIPALKSAADLRGFRFDYGGAADQYRRVAALTPRDHVVWDQLCWALGYVQPPRLEEAEQACRRCIGLQPDYPAAHYHLLRVHVLAGRLEEAEREQATVERLSAGMLTASGRFWLSLGRGRPAEALAALASRDRSTNLDEAWRAMALAQQGRKEEALSRLETALAAGYRDEADLRLARWYEPLRKDPRWRETLRRHGLGK